MGAVSGAVAEAHRPGLATLPAPLGGRRHHGRAGRLATRGAHDSRRGRLVALLGGGYRDRRRPLQADRRPRAGHAAARRLPPAAGAFHLRRAARLRRRGDWLGARGRHAGHEPRARRARAAHLHRRGALSARQQRRAHPGRRGGGAAGGARPAAARTGPGGGRLLLARRGRLLSSARFDNGAGQGQVLHRLLPAGGGGGAAGPGGAPRPRLGRPA